MSFFIKKNVKNGLNKFSSDSRKRKLSKKTEKSEEISSSDEEDLNEQSDKSPSEDENETAQEKKVRLAKIYLEEIQKAERKQLENKELDDACNGDFVQRRLKEDYLKQAGKLRLTIAKKYTGFKPEDITVLKCKEHAKALTALCISNDNKFIYSGSKDGSIVKWSLDDKKKVLSLPYKKSDDEEVKGHSKTILSIAISWDSKFLAVGDETNDIQIWNPENLHHIHTFKGHRGAVTGLVFRKDTHCLYSCSKDRCVKVWTLDEMSYVETLYGHLNEITSIDALSRERALTAGGGDGTVRIWKIAEESQLIFNADFGNIDCVKLINEEQFISGGDAGELCLWAITRKRASCVKKNAHGLNKNNDQPNWITTLASLVNTDLMASGSNNGTIKIWKIIEKDLEVLFEVPIEGFINALCFTNDGRYLIAAVGREHRFGRWEVMKAAKNSIVIVPLQKQDS